MLLKLDVDVDMTGRRFRISTRAVRCRTDRVYTGMSPHLRTEHGSRT